VLLLLLPLLLLLLQNIPLACRLAVLYQASQQHCSSTRYIAGWGCPCQA
jgi:hypothetical protein